MAVRDTASLLAGLLLVLLHTWGALAAVEVNMKDKVEVYLRGTAHIPCMYTSEEGSGSLEIQWFYLQAGNRHKIYSQDSMTKTLEKNTPYSNRISVNESPGEVVLSISDIKLEDEVAFICHVKSLSEDSTEGRTMLKVFEKPELFTIEGVTTGISLNENSPSKIGTCEVKNGYPKPNLMWYKNNMPMHSTPDLVKVESSTTTGTSGLLSVRSTLSLKVTKEDINAQFYCEATFSVPGGEVKMIETKKININVIYPSTSVKFRVESPQGKIKEGDRVELHCGGDGNSPSTISIKNTKTEKSWDGGEVVLENVTRLDSGDYKCTVTDMDTFDEISNQTSVFVNYLDRAVFNTSDTVMMNQGDEIKATCNALSSLHTNTTWFKNSEKISKDHSLILKDAKFSTAGTYVCVVTVPEIEGMNTSSSLRVHVRGRPEIQEKDVTEMETFEKTVNLSCHVSGYPTPKITWTTSDGKVIPTVPQIETEAGAKSLLTVQVPSDLTVFCNASNEHGTDGATFNIKAKTTIHTTTIPVTTTTTTIPVTTTTTTTTTTTPSTIPKATVKTETSNPSKKNKKESNGVIIAVIIICILLLAILGSVLYFLYKKGKICNRSGKQDITKEKSSKDNIVVEMKSDNTEEAILLGVNGDKQPPGDQDGEYLHVQA